MTPSLLPIAWHNHAFVAADRVAISPFDLGFTQAATAVERFRTWRGALPPLQDHWTRFDQSATTLGIAPFPDKSVWSEAVSELLARNAPDADAGFTLLATPGTGTGATPNLIMLMQELPLERLKQQSQLGQPLCVSDTQQPAPECWPRHIKVRSRLHYFLADRNANQRVKGSLAVLCDNDGAITETSTSNVLVISHETIVMPPEDRVLPGVMAKTLTRLMEAEGWQLIRRPISPAELKEAEEVWLTGSLGGLWGASAVDDIAKPISDRLRVWQRKLEDYLAGENPRVNGAD